MPAKFVEAPAVEKIAQKLIHDKFPQLAGVPIKYTFRDQAAQPVGKITLARMFLFSGLRGFLGVASEEERDELIESQRAPSFFVAEVAQPMWEKLTDHQKEACVHELLCQCYAEEVTDKAGEFRKLSLLPYDMQGFAVNIQEFGLWKEDLRLIAQGIAPHIQPMLDLGPVTTQKAIGDKRANAKAREAEHKTRKKPNVKGGGNSREETGDELLTIGGRDYKAHVGERLDGTGVFLFISQVDSEGLVLKYEAEDVPFDSKEAAWAFVDEWAAAKRAEGSNGSTPLKVEEGGKKAAAGRA